MKRPESHHEMAFVAPTPLSRSGNPDERALLRDAGVPQLEAAQAQAILSRLEDHWRRPSQRRPRRTLVLALATTLIAGTALAYGVARLAERPRVPQPLTASAPRADAVAAPAHADAPAPVAAPASSSAARSTLKRPLPPRRTAAGPPLEQPALRHFHDLGRLPEAPDESATALPTPAPPRLTIRRADARTVDLVIAGDRVVGRADQARVALTVSSAELTGRLGPHAIVLRLHGRRAEGTVSGWPVRFELADIPGGQALRVVGVGLRPLFAAHTQLESTATTLTWPSRCTATRSDPAARYEGRCATGGPVAITIPAAWQQMPPLPRLILLALFLSESDPLRRL
jgi:hypothetical protein